MAANGTFISILRHYSTNSAQEGSRSGVPQPPVAASAARPCLAVSPAGETSLRLSSPSQKAINCLSRPHSVLPEGLEPPTTASKAAMISISPRERIPDSTLAILTLITFNFKIIPVYSQNLLVLEYED